MNNTLSRGNETERIGILKSKRFFLFIALIIVVSIAIVAMLSIQQNLIEYASKYPIATPSALCPGDSFTYRVQIEVKEPETVVVLTEDWCVPNTNICPRAYVTQPIAHNSLDPAVVDTPATRSVPVEIKPGEWEFRHCNTSITSGKPLDVACYGVAITVLSEEVCKSRP